MKSGISGVILSHSSSSISDLEDTCVDDNDYIAEP